MWALSRGDWLVQEPAWARCYSLYGLYLWSCGSTLDVRVFYGFIWRALKTGGVRRRLGWKKCECAKGLARGGRVFGASHLGRRQPDLNHRSMWACLAGLNDR